MRFVDEVCNIFDCEVLCDIEEVRTSRPVLVYLVSEPEWRVKPVVAIGSRGDFPAGLVSFVMTPFFNTLEELDEFCSRHIEKFRRIGEDPDAPAPDATCWDAAISH